MEKKLGVEIELTGVTREVVVNALENFFHSKAIPVVSETTEDNYIYYKVKDMNGDTWRVVRDRSISAQVYDESFNVRDIDDTEYMVELISPPLTSKSLPLLFSIIDIIKALGGLTNESCGIHVHVDRPEELNDCILLYNRFLLEQESIFDKFKVNQNRIETYCKKLDSDKPITGSDSEQITEVISLISHVHSCNVENDLPLRKVRYYGLNMYSLLAHGTIEFRIFNSSLNRVDVATILDWVLHFMYTSEEYNNYIPILGSILMNEMKVEE